MNLASMKGDTELVQRLTRLQQSALAMGRMDGTLINQFASAFVDVPLIVGNALGKTRAETRDFLSSGAYDVEEIMNIISESDRVWRLAGDERDKIASVLRTDILRGESVGTMIRNVRRVHDNDTWKIERLVVTEGNTAYRAAADFNAKAYLLERTMRMRCVLSYLYRIIAKNS